jgi:hypothetical protein
MKIKKPRIKTLEYAQDGKTYSAYQVVWSVDGKRQRKQLPDLASARLFASEIHTGQINEGNLHRSMATTLSETQLRECEAALARLAGHYSISEAVEHFLNHHRDPGVVVPLKDAIARFAEAKRGNERDNSLFQYLNTLSRFERYTANEAVHEITTEQIEDFIHTYRARDGVNPAAPKTWNEIRGHLHAFLNWCIEKPQRYITQNPASDVKTFKLEKGDIHVLDVGACERLMRYVETFNGGELVPYFAIALFAGVRPSFKGELGKLPKKENAVSLSNDVIRITPDVSKIRDARQVTIQPNLKAWLTKYSGPIFPLNAKRNIASIRKHFGLDNPAGRDIMRHTFISNHVMAFGSFAETAIESGNSEKIIRTNYFNRVSKADAQRFWQIAPVDEAGKIIPMALAS